MPEKLLTSEQIQTIKSMNEYWEEVYRRDRKTGILLSELKDLTEFIGAEAILRIISDYALNQK